MKKIYALMATLFVAFMGLTLASCGSDDDENGGNNGGKDSDVQISKLVDNNGVLSFTATAKSLGETMTIDYAMAYDENDAVVSFTQTLSTNAPSMYSVLEAQVAALCEEEGVSSRKISSGKYVVTFDKFVGTPNAHSVMQMLYDELVKTTKELQ